MSTGLPSAAPIGETWAMNTVSPPSSMLVACLCAQWCGTCRDYRALFESLLQDEPTLAGRVHLAWVDIEDEADAVGALDVENFPTLLIAQGGQVRFFGPLLPQRQTLLQTVQHALAGPLMQVDDPALASLLQHLAKRSAAPSVA